MKHGFLYRFLVRWLVSALGLWIAAAFLGSHLTYNNSAAVLVVAGFILAIVNSVLKPIVVFLSLPAVLITLGLFMLVINALMIMLVAWLYGPFNVSGFWPAVLAGIVIGLVNYLVTAILESREKKE